MATGAQANMLRAMATMGDATAPATTVTNLFTDNHPSIMVWHPRNRNKAANGNISFDALGNPDL